jgi:DNA transformation protein and related proteins
MNRDAARVKLQSLLNLGPKSADWLIDAGFETPEEIAELGAVEVWKRTRELHPEFNLMGLYALQAALMDLHWRDLPEDIKADLRQQVGR